MTTVTSTDEKPVPTKPVETFPTPPWQGLSAKFAYWTVLLGALLFLAGWRYVKAYFGVFGLDTGSLDLGFQDTVVHGFSAIFGTGAFLSIAYLVVLLVSLYAEIFYGSRGRIVDALLVLTIVALFPITYEIAWVSGIAQANADRSEDTRLPTVVFNSGSCDYRGKLLYAKSESLYVYNLAYVTKPARSVRCPLELTDMSSDVPQLWLVRASDLKNVKLIHYSKEAAH